MIDFNKHEVTTLQMHGVDGIHIGNERIALDDGTYFSRTLVTVNSRYGKVVLDLFSDYPIC